MSSVLIIDESGEGGRNGSQEFVIPEIKGPARKYPEVLDAMYAEDQQLRSKAKSRKASSPDQADSSLEAEYNFFSTDRTISINDGNFNQNNNNNNNNNNNDNNSLNTPSSLEPLPKAKFSPSTIPQTDSGSDSHSDKKSSTGSSGSSDNGKDLMTSYGLIFLIFTGSLSIVAASLLGLSIAFTSKSQTNGKNKSSCCGAWTCFGILGVPNRPAPHQRRTSIKRDSAASQNASKSARNSCGIASRSTWSRTHATAKIAPCVPRPAAVDSASLDVLSQRGGVGGDPSRYSSGSGSNGYAYSGSYTFQALADSVVGSIRSFAGGLGSGLGSGSAAALAKKQDSEIPTVDAEDSAWSMYHTEEGVPYYYNALTGKTSWDPPENVALAESVSSQSSYYSSVANIPNTCKSITSLP